MSVNLSTRYLGLTLKNPVVVAACPLTGKVEWLQRLEEGGAAAAVLPSLFQEQVEHDTEELTNVHEFGTDSFAEALTYFPEPQDYRTGPEHYLELIAGAKKAVKMPIIASLNGTNTGGWIRYARMMQDSGADALELNVYYVAADAAMSGADVEAQYLELVEAVKQSVSIPLSVKIGPYFSSVGHFCKRLSDAGADGLVLFNRFLQPDIDIDTLETDSRLILSDPYELLLPLRWTAILRGRIKASLAVTSGVHDHEALIKALLVGADVGMIASVLYNEGFDFVGKMLEKVSAWMEAKEYESVEQLKGSMSQENCPDPEAFARGNYMKALVTYTGKMI
jgi:dihydroorotate dehydrogenase (fumarate)